MDISLQDLKSLLADNKSSTNQDSVFIGKRVIVRSREAGVMYGTLKKLNGRYVLLENARIIWRWRNKNGGVALNDTAISGIKNDGYSRLSNFNDRLEMLEACSIIAVSKESEKNLDSIQAYNNKDEN